VSAFPVDGTSRPPRPNTKSATSRWTFRFGTRKFCIQCLKCVAICPHATIRAKIYEPAALQGAPGMFKSVDSRVPDFKGFKFTLQVAAEDCTGCAPA